VAICTKNKINVFGKIENNEMHLNLFGEIVNSCWHDLINHYKNIELDEYIIMPNHFHGIIWLVGNGLKPFQKTTNQPVGNGLKPFRNHNQDITSPNRKILQPDRQSEEQFKTVPKLKPETIQQGRNGLKPNKNTKEQFETVPYKIHGLPEIIRGFKTFSSRRVNEIKTNEPFRWQKSYFDRIIRNDKELNNIRNYIIQNPMNWEKDDNFSF
jgi:REP element-mobilizing transposase RayT